MAKYIKKIITSEFLDLYPDVYFIFGDNLTRKGSGGAAKLRHHPHAIGFITKKFPDNNDSSFYRPTEYSPVFFEELEKLNNIVKLYPSKIFYVSQLGAGLANKFRIWELLIRDNLVRKLEKFDNVIFCWDDNINT
jgi:hypothetical protein